MESSRARGWTRVPCIARRILNHWITREALADAFIHLLGIYWDSASSLIKFYGGVPKKTPTWSFFPCRSWQSFLFFFLEEHEPGTGRMAAMWYKAEETSASSWPLRGIPLAMLRYHHSYSLDLKTLWRGEALTLRRLPIHAFLVFCKKKSNAFKLMLLLLDLWTFMTQFFFV